MRGKQAILALGLTLGLAMFGPAAQAGNEIQITKAWARATPPAAKTGAIYLTITNTGSAPDTVEGASSPAADKVELHEMKMENGVMEMRPVPALTIAPGESLVLKPNGYHLMLIGLKAPLKEGQMVPLTVTFQHAGALQAMASVAKVGAAHADDKGGSDMSTMPGMQH